MTDTAFQVVADAADAGVSLWVEDGRLRFRGPAGVVDDQLRRRIAGLRASLVDLLRSGLEASRGSWPEAARADFEERAAVMEHEGGLSLAEAELRAEARVRLGVVRASTS